MIEIPDRPNDYVLGFAFRHCPCGCGHAEVALVQKLRPSWMAGKLNGVGGHIKENESPAEAMAREFHEEAGVLTSAWRPFGIFHHGPARVHLFRADLLEDARLKDQFSAQEEDVHWYLADQTLYNNSRLIPNLKILIPCALDKSVRTVNLVFA